MRRKPRIPARLIAGLLAAAVAGAACTGPAAPDGGRGDGGQTDSGSPPVVSPGPGQANGDPAATATVEQAYRRFWNVALGVDRKPVSQWRPTLAVVAGEPLLDQLLDGLLKQRTQGTQQYGVVLPRPTVAYLVGGRASVVDCQDASGSGEVDRSNGTVQRIGSARTSVAATLERDGEGRWRVTEAKYLADPC